MPVETQTEETASKTSTEEPKVVEIRVGDQIIRGKQATVPTGLFPVPSFIRRLAGLSH